MSFVYQPEEISYANSPILYDVYLSTNGNTNFKYNLAVTIWSGDISASGSGTTYNLSKSPNAAGKATFDVSKLVKEFIVVTNPSDITETWTEAVYDAVWVKAVLTATWTGGSQSAINSNTSMATRGYSFYVTEEVNSTNDSHTGETFPTGFGTYVARDQGILEAYGCINENLLRDYEYLYPSGGFLPTYAPLTYKTFDDGRLSLAIFTQYIDEIVLTDDNGNSKTFLVGSGDTIGTRMKYLNLNVRMVRFYGLSPTNYYYLTTYKDGIQYASQYTFEIVCEPKYQPMQLIYLNKMGVWDYFTFYKASTETLNTEKTNYFNTSLSLGDDTTAVSYDRERGERRSHNANGYRSYSMNSGYVDEKEKERIEQLLLSERVILDTGSSIYAVEVTTSSQTMQKSINRKVINYTIEVRDAFRRINKVNS